MANLVKEFDSRIAPDTSVEIVVDIDESIHVHNLYTKVKDTLMNMKQNLN